MGHLSFELSMSFLRRSLNSPWPGVILNEEKSSFGNRIEHANFIYVAICSFTFKHIATDASSARSVNILERFNAYQYRIYQLDFCSTISTSFDFYDLVKGRFSDVYRFMSRLAFSLDVAQITTCFFCHESHRSQVKKSMYSCTVLMQMSKHTIPFL